MFVCLLRLEPIAPSQTTFVKRFGNYNFYIFFFMFRVLEIRLCITALRASFSVVSCCVSSTVRLSTRQTMCVTLIICDEISLNKHLRVLLQLGDTPLHIACRLSHSSIVKELLREGADVHITNNVRMDTTQVHYYEQYYSIEYIMNLIVLLVGVYSVARNNQSSH